MFLWNSAILCPAPLTQNCPVDCVGSWGVCAGPPLAQFKTYSWTTLPLNGGSAATCTYPNGQTDATGCNSCPTIGDYTYRSAGSCWTFSANANGNYCSGEKSPECLLDWVPVQTFWGAPHPHNTAKCNNAGGAQVTASCGIPQLGQIVQCCDSNINIGAQTGADCIQYRCN